MVLRPCRHLRPYSGREHTVVILTQSGEKERKKERKREREKERKPETLVPSYDMPGIQWTYSIPGSTQGPEFLVITIFMNMFTVNVGPEIQQPLKDRICDPAVDLCRYTVMVAKYKYSQTPVNPPPPPVS